MLKRVTGVINEFSYKRTTGNHQGHGQMLEVKRQKRREKEENGGRRGEWTRVG